MLISDLVKLFECQVALFWIPHVVVSAEMTYKAGQMSIHAVSTFSKR